MIILEKLKIFNSILYFTFSLVKIKSNEMFQMSNNIFLNFLKL